ncbi:helix-turn-helix domain-containing protein [Acidaminobacter hydrogenoformans]|uniref:Helix-turn-helix domain-containing protein n=1 Tax=Acidaminobacter hydrogenoformans DSM 2784 TaxID=1120920 RepID=A0A1G5S143_9FIRM|nr:helix-turn-helix domain-containing protein [Acidaminobacter hydrogenoformans]SCZ80006.1 Helix-turn-helix domain-containing protein [Acidaminobacter hydrogenoformans DSM 2784]
MKVLSELLNPVRMKIVQVISEKGTATSKEIAEAVPGVPIASLYRHIKKLFEIGILEVISETPVRGTVEKTYRVRSQPFEAIEEAVASGDRDAHYELFYTFAMSMLMDFSNYIAGPNYDLVNDRVGFRSYPIYMTDEVCDDFLKDFSDLLVKYLGPNAKSEGRLRKFSFALMPGDEKQ